MSRHRSYLLALTVLAIATAGGTASAATTIYVSPKGSDKGSGAITAPLASLQGARDRVRAMRKAGRATGAATVVIADGTYRLGEPLVFGPEDSQVTYAAAEGAKPVVSGGVVIGGWRKQGNVWAAEVPGVREGKLYFHQLFVNGQRRVRARTPNAGFFSVDGMIDGVFTWGKPIEDAPPSSFKFRDDDIKPDWAERGDVEVVALQSWAEIRMQIRAVDAAQKRVNLAGACSPSNREGNARYWVENAPECLDAPGEWYLDRKTGVVTYSPMPGEQMGKVEVVAPVLKELVRFAGDAEGGKPVENVTLRGLTFAHADWSLGEHGYTDVQAAYDIPAHVGGNGAVSCAIERCRFTHLGAYAIAFVRGCAGNRIDRCEMTDLGAGGVKIGEVVAQENAALHTTGNAVTNCRIHDIGIVYPAAVGVWIGQSDRNLVGHNEIFDTCYSAISVGWTWGYSPTLARDNIIEFNHLHDVARGWLSDLGAIYTLGMQPGTVLRNNVCHDIDSYGYGGWGLYNDEGSSGMVMENNVVYRTKSGGFHHHYGKENVWRNNIFAFAREHQINRSREEAHRSFTFEHNIVLLWHDGLLGGNWGNGQFAMDYNDYWVVGGAAPRFADWSFEEWQKRGFDLHSIIADPMFVDAEHGDFTLKPGSPAIALGFKPIDVSDVGPAVDPPGKFKLAGPRGSTTVLPTFEWEASEEATSYTLVVSRKADLTQPIERATVAGLTSYAPVEPLPAKATLYWQVTAENRKFKAASVGGVAKFTTDQPLPWWDKKWTERRRVVLTPPAMSEPLSDFPLLVRLGPNDTKLWAKVKADGGDLRFAGQDDGGRWTELACEIGRLDAKAGVAEIWVRLPRLVPTTGQYFWMYFGNAKATRVMASAGVWDGGFRGVWHLGDGRLPLRDSTKYGRDMTAVGAPTLGAEGVVDGGVEFKGGESASAAPAGGPAMANATVAMWEKTPRLPDGATLFSLPGLVMQAWFSDKINPGVNTPQGWGGFGWVPGGGVLGNVWHYLVFTYDGQRQRYYEDGQKVGEKVIGGALTEETTGPTIGGVEGKPGVIGTLDEVELSDVARSADWVAASYENQRPGSGMVTVKAGP